MEDKINKLLDEMRRLSTRLDNLERMSGNIDRKTEELIRETGANEGLSLSRMFNDLMERVRRSEEKLNNIERDVASARSLIEYGDSNIQEIKQALALIYRNTDELEETLIPEGRKTT